MGTSRFNYGVADEVLRGRGHNPTFPHQFAGRCLTGDVRLAKLHGSLSWTDTAKYTSGKPGRAGAALIVAPSPEKTVPSNLTFTWDLGAEILQDSRYLIVFGFAFNPYDAALLDLLRATGRRFGHVLLIDPKPAMLAAKSLWPKALIETAAPEENLHDVLTEWQKGA